MQRGRIQLPQHRQLIGTLNETRIGQLILSGILPVIGSIGQGYRNCRRKAINALVCHQFMGEACGIFFKLEAYGVI